MIQIKIACKKDAAVILTLQKCAYQREARRYNDDSIPPLTQSINDIEAEFNNQLFLKAVDGNRIVGSVRARVDGTDAFIGRLIVHPAHQRQGIGTQLMVEIETRLSGCSRFELFTGTKSRDNIRLYERLGYRRFRQETVHPGLSLLYLEKIRP